MGGWLSKSSANSNGSSSTMGGMSSRELSAILAPPSLEISKQLLDFNTKEGGCPINTPVFDEFTLKNVDSRKIKFKFEPVCPSSCQLQFTPTTGTLDRNKMKLVKVKLILFTSVNLNFKITLRIEGGPALFINMRVSGEADGVFGVDPTTLDQTDDNGYQVPTVLVEMKNLIISRNGHKSEGIFRLAGEQTEIQRIKNLINKKQFDGTTNDINAIASLIKIFFRDLPVPILNCIDDATIMHFQDATDCIAAYNNLPEPQSTLLSWLLNFLSLIASNADENKMTAQNLAIVVAPNLHDISTPNPMEGLVLSQKCAQFLYQLLNSRISKTI